MYSNIHCVFGEGGGVCVDFEWNDNCAENIYISICIDRQLQYSHNERMENTIIVYGIIN